MVHTSRKVKQLCESKSGRDLDCVAMETLNDREKQDMRRWGRAFQVSGTASVKTVGWEELGTFWKPTKCWGRKGVLLRESHGQAPGLKALLELWEEV